MAMDVGRESDEEKAIANETCAWHVLVVLKVGGNNSSNERRKRKP